jgi:hypothetical protein
LVREGGNNNDNDDDDDDGDDNNNNNNNNTVWHMEEFTQQWEGFIKGLIKLN